MLCVVVMCHPGHQNKGAGKHPPDKQLFAPPMINPKSASTYGHLLGTIWYTPLYSTKSDLKYVHPVQITSLLIATTP